jgi:hypothetical protein
VPPVKFGGGGVTVWGAMSYRGPGFLHTIHSNLNTHGYIDILSNVAPPLPTTLDMATPTSSKMMGLLVRGPEQSMSGSRSMALLTLDSGHH